LRLIRGFVPILCAVGLALTAASVAGAEEKATEPFKPYSGQPGKDVVWVPTPDSMVEKMLDIASVTADDYVIDLGSGDGRNVIAAAKRGATALGVEYNDKMVTLSRELAAKAGVADKATFVQGDMFAADISKASALVLFLLSENLNKLVPKFLAMKPGTRIVVNTFRINGWEPVYSETVEKCSNWCTVHLYIVPANAGGTWTLDGGTLKLNQSFQAVHGSLSQGGNESKVLHGQLQGNEISFIVAGTRYRGSVDGERMTGEIEDNPGAKWTATRTQ
jgi:SAM-dependent methyltransferase